MNKQELLENVFDVLCGNTVFVPMDYFIKNFDIEYDKEKNRINIYNLDQDIEEDPICVLRIQ